MRTLIIAEAGVNNNGRLDLALEMVHKAKEAGADIVKFQTGKPEYVMSRYAEKAEYQKQTTGGNESQLEMVKKLMLPFEDFRVIKEECDKAGIRFLSTPFELTAIDCLTELNGGMWKIPSGEITNLPYLIKIAKMKQKVIISTGMAVMEEIHAAVDILNKYGTEDIVLLHCNTQYPTPYHDVNLRAMVSMKKEFGLPVGYSDHTEGIEVPIAAVAMGAAVIEKHFTLSRDFEGPDHKASIEPNELARMIEKIRHIEEAQGDGVKRVTESEAGNKTIARKSIVAKKDIGKGETLTEENITVKRPGNGISPMEWFNILGTKAISDFMEDELIRIC